MNDNNKKKRQLGLEVFGDFSRDTLDTLNRELLSPFPAEISRQVFNKKRLFSGEIVAGEHLEMQEVYSGQREEAETLRIQLSYERKLREEEKTLIENRTTELKIQIHAIHEEMLRLAAATPQLSHELEVAAFQAPSNPSIYEKFFLERIFELIKNFRMKIEDASNWLSAANRRAAKRNVWGQNYKKYGAKYLLSGEHYSSRSAA
ncbi:hypothetical protein A2801_00575 [Candidatus Woesebacteria bacterium RIFCSPHIGHO2_01_FULL_41_10]|uniref:DUF5660 domain-containing protein n=1 Tax=Candidatus Woesebacteria bacterium RIFCSPHIGHO2_01_FULL_41_10 TaxID=1802500 RepID=A0A1F7YQM9_9BACT|nr:MAG: hypothetical protein A2801_00575 [Candidatus Woesebacteria bacterium RIFCSPHIGHO2_01_FULL_41_10]